MLRLTRHFLLSRFILIYFAQHPREQAMCDEVIIAIVIIIIITVVMATCYLLFGFGPAGYVKLCLGGRIAWVWRLTHYTLGGWSLGPGMGGHRVGVGPNNSGSVSARAPSGPEESPWQQSR